MMKVLCFVLVVAVFAYATADDATTAATTAAATTPSAATTSSTAASAAHPVRDAMMKGMDMMNAWQKQMADTGKQMVEKGAGFIQF